MEQKIYVGVAYFVPERIYDCLRGMSGASATAKHSVVRTSNVQTIRTSTTAPSLEYDPISQWQLAILRDVP